MPAWTPPAPLRTDVTPETLSDPAHPNLHNATSTAVNTIVSMLGTDPTQGASTLTAFLAGLASASFTPAVSGNWSPAPTTIAAGLNQLAARLKTLETTVAGLGAATNTILTTSGVPSSGVGANGDYAYDPATFTMYGPKLEGAWPSGVVLKGADGVGVVRVQGFATAVPAGTPAGTIVIRVP